MMMLMDARMCVLNENFMEDLQGAGLSKSQRLVMVCQEGLRSKMAADEATKRGYESCSYMLGGFRAYLENDFPAEGDWLLKNAARGGAGRYYTLSTVAIVAAFFFAILSFTIVAPEQAAKIAADIGL